ncbi:MAG TPA: hypothetical protein VK543_01090, partial [Puia sp.]|nr:hypothetical protein [Puia sp.]
MMKSLRWTPLVLLFAFSTTVRAQTPAVIDSIQFFVEDKPMEVTLSLDLKVLIGEKPEKKNYIPATFT